MRRAALLLLCLLAAPAAHGGWEFNVAEEDWLESTISVGGADGFPSTVHVRFATTADKNLPLVAQVDADGGNNERATLMARDVALGKIVSASSRGGGAGATAADTSTQYAQTGAPQTATAIWATNVDRRAFVNGGGKGTDSADVTPTGIDVTIVGGAFIPVAGQRGNGNITGMVAIFSVALTDAQVGSLAAGAWPPYVSPNLAIFLEMGGENSAAVVDAMNPTPFVSGGASVPLIAGHTNMAPRPGMQQ